VALKFRGDISSLPGLLGGILGGILGATILMTLSSLANELDQSESKVKNNSIENKIIVNLPENLLNSSARITEDNADEPTINLPGDAGDQNPVD
jgi:hypothetical protein